MKHLTDKKEQKIVTFSCMKNIYIYTKDSATLPRQPYSQHKTIEDAKKVKPKAEIIKV